MAGRLTLDDSGKRARIAMRKRAQKEDDAGFKRVTIALSPVAVQVLEQFKTARGHTSRQDAINAICEEIDTNMFLRQELLAVST